jgi:hypothetical protein
MKAVLSTNCIVSVDWIGCMQSLTAGVLQGFVRLDVNYGSNENRKSARSYRTGILASRNPPLIQQMLEALVRDGYLKSVVQGCVRRPAGERMSVLCNQARIWILTEKGEKLLAKTNDLSKQP